MHCLIIKSTDHSVVNIDKLTYAGNLDSLNEINESDKYFFENIKCKCPGDPAARNIGQMVFNVK